MSQKTRQPQPPVPTQDPASGNGRAPSAQELTRREHEVLNWIAEGKRDAEIGTILSISVHTVRKHVQNLFVKLGVENRTAAARFATGPAPLSDGANGETP